MPLINALRSSGNPMRRQTWLTAVSCTPKTRQIAVHPASDPLSLKDDYHFCAAKGGAQERKKGHRVCHCFFPQSWCLETQLGFLQEPYKGEFEPHKICSSGFHSNKNSSSSAKAEELSRSWCGMHQGAEAASLC